MTDTTILREKIAALTSYDQCLKRPLAMVEASDGDGNWICRRSVLAILDAQTEQPDLQLSARKVEGDAPDQTVVSSGSVPVAEPVASVADVIKNAKVIAQHSGCGYGRQGDQVWVSMDRGDKVVLLTARELALLTSLPPTVNDPLAEAIPADGLSLEAMRMALQDTPAGRAMISKGDVGLYWLNQGDVNAAVIRYASPPPSAAPTDNTALVEAARSAIQKHEAIKHDAAYSSDEHIQEVASAIRAALASREAKPGPDAVGEAAVGPRPAFPTCKGCPALVEEQWREPSGDGETYDSGTSQNCKAAERSIATYGSPNPLTPDWCPALAQGSRP